MFNTGVAINKVVHIVLKLHAAFRHDHNAPFIGSLNNLLSGTSGKLVVAFNRYGAR